MGLSNLGGSILADFEQQDIKSTVEECISIYLKDNYVIRGHYEIVEVDNELVVNVRGNAIVGNKNISSLTNGLFKFGCIDGFFDCCGCDSLTSLKGAPNEVKGFLDCSNCVNLSSFEDVSKNIVVLTK